MARTRRGDIVQETSRVFSLSVKIFATPGVYRRGFGRREGRLQTALHYGIAYPRMTHTPLAGGGDVKNVLPPAEAGGSSWASHVGEKGVSDAARNIAAHAAPVNPRANAAGRRSGEEARDDEGDGDGDGGGQDGGRRGRNRLEAAS